MVQCVRAKPFYFLGKSSLFFEIDQFYLIFWGGSFRFIFQKIQHPTDFVVELVRFLCFKSDSIRLLIFFGCCSRVDATERLAAGIRNVRHRQGRDPAIYRMRERSDHSRKQTQYFPLCCLSVSFFVLFLLFFYRRIPRAHFLSFFNCSLSFQFFFFLNLKLLFVFFVVVAVRF